MKHEDSVPCSEDPGFVLNTEPNESSDAIHLRSILIIFSYLRLGFATSFFTSCSQTNILHFSSPHELYMCNSYLLDLINVLHKQTNKWF